MAKGLRSGMGIAALVLLAGSIVLMFFVVLSGVTNTLPLRNTYFLQADTSSFSGAERPVSQWTYFYICGEGNANCGAPVPALPFGYAWVGGSEGVPAGLTGSHGKGTTSTYYYYMWRFGWVFYLIALALNVIGFFLAMLAPFSRLASAIAGSVTLGALFFFSLAAPLMTAEFVQARNEFRRAGIDATIGRYAFGFTWGAWAALALACIFLFTGCAAGGRHGSDHVTTTRNTTNAGGSTRFFRRQRSKRSARGSFIDNESQRRVKDEYA